VLHKMLQRGGSMPYEEVGRLAILLGETALAEKLIHDLEKRNEDYSDRQAGAIAAKLPDEAEAYRLLRKFEEKGNQAAALHIAVEIGDAEAVQRVLIDIIQYGNIDATPGYFADITESLLKAVPAFPALGKRVLMLVEKQREIADVFPQE